VKSSASLHLYHVPAFFAELMARIFQYRPVKMSASYQAVLIATGGLSEGFMLGLEAQQDLF
jgi:hypothetical protein